MQSKRDKLFLAAEQLGCLTCPVCGGALLRTGDDFACERHHRVNVNRKGCLNVLSSRVDSCYDADLFAARRRVFDAGCYDAVVQAIEAMLPEDTPRILDAGCGDGWYLNALLSRHEGWCGAGLDISRDAILQATNHPCTALWVVGDLRRLPFSDASFTAVLDVLTPANYDEFRRVLAPDGLLIKVYPGSAYLRELRAARRLPPYEEGQVDAYLREKAAIVAETRVTVTHAVSDALWRDFVWMTPLMQDLSTDEKDAIAAKNAGYVTIDLHVTACRTEEHHAR